MCLCVYLYVYVYAYVYADEVLKCVCATIDDSVISSDGGPLKKSDRVWCGRGLMLGRTRRRALPPAKVSQRRQLRRRKLPGVYPRSLVSVADWSARPVRSHTSTRRSRDVLNEFWPNASGSPSCRSYGVMEW